MSTANATPRPATVTNPPPWASNEDAPAVLTTVPAEVVLDAAPEPEAEDLVELPEPLVAVAVAVAAVAFVAPVAVDAFDDFDALLEDCR